MCLKKQIHSVEYMNIHKKKHSMKLPSVLAVSITLSICFLTARADYHVAQNGQTPAPPYSGWTTAASNIQEAVDAADIGATIWVAEGTYYAPDSPQENSVVYITKPLILRSDSSDPAKVIIDGGATCRGVTIYLTQSAEEYGPAILDGFTITNCYNNLRAAGIYISAGANANAATTIQNCIVTGNLLEKVGENRDAGGAGIYCISSDIAPVISNCLIKGNTAVELNTLTNNLRGGGVFFRTPGLITDCVITENSASYSGGGIYLSIPGTTIERCLITSNTAPDNAFGGGGLYVNSSSLEALRNSLLINNSAIVGADLRFYGGATKSIHNNTIGKAAMLREGGGDFQNNIILTMSIVTTHIITGRNNCLPFTPASGEWHDTVLFSDPGEIKFLDPDNNNYRLMPDSPCVNAGNNQMDWILMLWI